jgi:hypothetical protein
MGHNPLLGLRQGAVLRSTLFQALWSRLAHLKQKAKNHRKPIKSGVSSTFADLGRNS